MFIRVLCVVVDCKRFSQQSTRNFLHFFKLQSTHRSYYYRVEMDILKAEIERKRKQVKEVEIEVNVILYFILITRQVNVFLRASNWLSPVVAVASVEKALSR